MADLITFAFDDAAERAAAIADKIAAKMVTEITDATESAIRNLVSHAISEGIPPYDAARAIVPMIGLTSAQSQAVLKYRRELIDNGLSLDSVNDKIDEYAEELLVRRGEAIARTEIMDALNAGQDEAWLQAQDEGLLSDNATKEVILTDDACEICEAIAAEGPVPISEGFSEEGPPFHPHCRCTTGIRTP